MDLSGRIRIIIDESGLNQKEFAKSINVTDSYISKTLRNESGMSNSTAMLIEKLYGYSKEWILTGREPKLLAGQRCAVSALQKRIMMTVEQMPDDELQVLLAFIESLKKITLRTPSQEANATLKRKPAKKK